MFTELKFNCLIISRWLILKCGLWLFDRLYGINWKRVGQWTLTFNDDTSVDALIFYEDEEYGFRKVEATKGWKRLYCKGFYLFFKYEVGAWTLKELTDYMTEKQDESKDTLC